MKTAILRLISISLIILSDYQIGISQADLYKYVDPVIGNQRGNTTPAASAPWGMVRLGPQTVHVGNRGLRPDGEIIGFGHTRINGTGCGGLGTSIILMPMSIKPSSFLFDEYKTRFSNEVAKPGYYSNELIKYNIHAEMSAQQRSAISRFTFPQGQSFILLDLSFSEPLKKPEGSMIRIVNDQELEGYETDGNFCNSGMKYRLYFIIKLSKKPERIQLLNDQKSFPSEVTELSGDSVKTVLEFKTHESEQIVVQVGISYVSIANARENLAEEIGSLSFDQARDKVQGEWNKQLSKIIVEGDNENDKKLFYTALYHILQHPSILNDVNGQYPAMSTGQIKTAEGRDRYTIFSLWDTYRTLHPFLTLVYPDKEIEMVQSMMDMYREGGCLPKWELLSQETYIMVGDPALPVITDTYMKGLHQFDVNEAYEAMKKDADGIGELGSNIRPGIVEYLNYGYLPIDAKFSVKPNQKTNVKAVVSTTLEYTYADWAIAQMAEALGKIDDHKRFGERSLYYRNLFDPGTGFFRPRNTDGSWFDPFDPVSEWGGDWGRGSPGFCEGSAWQYRFMVPHGINDLISLMGGDLKFTGQLQKFFDDTLYWLGNEPDILTPFLFNYVPGQEWRTQKTVRHCIRNHFDDSYNGLPGADDCGTMSAWLTFAMMGFYPVCPGLPEYQVTSPIFDKVTIFLDQQFYPGKQFVIQTTNNKSENIFIKSMQLNGKSFSAYQINHSDIVSGGKLSFELSNKLPE